MKYLIIPLLCMMLSSCSNSGKYGPEIPGEYDTPLDQAFDKAGENASRLKTLLDQAQNDRKTATAFLIAYMPDNDLRSIDTEIIEENVTYALKAREEFPWARNLPEDVFLNDVLPYAVVDETREPWRRKFYEMFGKRVRNCTTVEEAIERVNRDINKFVKVEYDTRRAKPNQSPAESMAQHKASCTGLAILLVDAFRSVGIPARFAGTPSWHDDRGNHSWVEVFVNGTWKITEFYMPRQLDRPWFLANAGKASNRDPKYAIYATSYRPTGESFPMVWDAGSRAVHGVDVTRRYNKLADEVFGQALDDGKLVKVAVRMFKDRNHHSQSVDRIAANVDVFEGQLQVDGGRTAGPHQDMNDDLSFFLEKNKTYTFKYPARGGGQNQMVIKVGDQPVTIITYMK